MMLPTPILRLPYRGDDVLSDNDATNPPHRHDTYDNDCTLQLPRRQQPMDVTDDANIPHASKKGGRYPTDDDDDDVMPKAPESEAQGSRN